MGDCLNLWQSEGSPESGDNLKGAAVAVAAASKTQNGTRMTRIKTD